jgi:hypothetical protein
MRETSSSVIGPYANRRLMYVRAAWLVRTSWYAFADECVAKGVREVVAVLGDDVVCACGKFLAQL